MTNAAPPAVYRDPNGVVEYRDEGNGLLRMYVNNGQNGPGVATPSLTVIPVANLPAGFSLVPGTGTVTTGPTGEPVPQNPLTQTDPVTQAPITNFPAPPGYAWGIDPTDNKKILIDLTPLDRSKPAENWHWVVNDPATPNIGQWVYTANQGDLDRTFAGVPKSVLPWLQYALNQGGSFNGVPQEAHAWLNYLISHSSDAGRLGQGEVPFGLGLPNFDGGTQTPTQAPTNETNPTTPTEVPFGNDAIVVTNPSSDEILPSGITRIGDVGPPRQVSIDNGGQLVWSGTGDPPQWMGSGPAPSWWFRSPTNLPNIAPPTNILDQPPSTTPTTTPTITPTTNPTTGPVNDTTTLNPNVSLPPPPPNAPDLTNVTPLNSVLTITYSGDGAPIYNTSAPKTFKGNYDNDGAPIYE